MEIKKRLGVFGYLSETELSLMATNKAAKGLGIERELTPGQMAAAVAQRH
ncbi:MAG: hypothetical protein GX766_04025 [Firmicutes bacterium]|jgi:hypothetical protein|nr:hypothetical protein [Bacillota bacterium]